MHSQSVAKPVKVGELIACSARLRGVADLVSRLVCAKSGVLC